jgi:hypothetical protein
MIDFGNTVETIVTSDVATTLNPKLRVKNNNSNAEENIKVQRTWVLRKHQKSTKTNQTPPLKRKGKIQKSKREPPFFS